MKLGKLGFMNEIRWGIAKGSSLNKVKIIGMFLVLNE